MKNVVSPSHGINGYLFKIDKSYRNWTTNNGVHCPPKLSGIWEIMRLSRGIYHEGSIFD